MATLLWREISISTQPTETNNSKCQIRVSRKEARTKMQLIQKILNMGKVLSFQIKYKGISDLTIIVNLTKKIQT